MSKFYAEVYVPPKGAKQQFVYYWQGKDSTQDERGVSALKVPRSPAHHFGGLANNTKTVSIFFTFTVTYTGFFSL